ncbi:MAG: hypothetical protein M3297_08995 [Thermoproteota archaeon]|nr:hypothetical protein [Thermoproteota archaeon]
MPSIRNYINHGFFQPTNILAVDLFEHLGRDVLIGEGKAYEYNILKGNVQRVANIKEKIRLQEELAMKIYSTYPARTLQVLMRNAVGIMGRAHWPFAARFWGYNFKDEFDPAHMKLKRLTVIFYLESFFNLVYFIVYLLFFGFLVRTFRVGNYMLFLVICLLIGYFLIPTFINPGGGSRMRLPVEGLIITMASCQFVSLFYAFKGKLLRLTRSAENLGPPAYRALHRKLKFLLIARPQQKTR